MRAFQKCSESFLYSDENLQQNVLDGSPNLEIYNSRFTHNFSEWALGFCGDIYEKDNPGSIYPADHSLQDVTSLDLSHRCIHNLNNKVRILQLHWLVCYYLEGNVNS